MPTDASASTLFIAASRRIAEGTHRIALGKAADDLVLTADAELTGRLFGR